MRRAMIGSPPGGHNSRRSGGEHRADIGQVLTAPEELPVHDKARHPENAAFLGGPADPLQLLPPFPRRISREAGSVGAGLREHRTDHARVLDVELAFPETLEGDVVIAP